MTQFWLGFLFFLSGVLCMIFGFFLGMALVIYTVLKDGYDIENGHIVGAGEENVIGKYFGRKV